MKITTTSLFLVLLSLSCIACKENSHPEAPPKHMGNQDKILKLMREYMIIEYENEYSKGFLTDEEFNELKKMKNDYLYQSKDPYISLPGSGWVVKGPMTLEQVEQKLLELIKFDPNTPQVPLGYGNDIWKELISKFKKGDIFFYFGSDDLSFYHGIGCSGYVLIRDNKVVGYISY